MSTNLAWCPEAIAHELQIDDGRKRWVERGILFTRSDKVPSVTRENVTFDVINMRAVDGRVLFKGMAYELKIYRDKESRPKWYVAEIRYGRNERNTYHPPTSLRGAVEQALAIIEEHAKPLIEARVMMRETYINADENRMFGESDWFEPYTEDRGRIFRDCQREYGKCVSKVYLEQVGQPDKPVGWVFQKRMAYEDDPTETYLREVWVEVREVLVEVEG